MTTTDILHRYMNGDNTVTLYKDGTRVIDEVGEYVWPLNIDIRVSTYCSFGSGTVCTFCHESASRDGVEGDYETLIRQLAGLPRGVELAIGCNKYTPKLDDFLRTTNELGFINNLTVNQGHLKSFRKLEYALDEGVVKGLGISFRPQFGELAHRLVDLPNSVVHVIVGIDSFEEVSKIKAGKLLILGEKDFGFNAGCVDKTRHVEWYRRVHELFSKFEIVSFDNLALEQLNMKRFFDTTNWNTFNQGEHSMYINAVAQTYSPSSRSPIWKSFDEVSLQEAFKEFEKA